MTKWILNVDGQLYEVEAAGVMSALAMVLGVHSRESDRDIAEITMVQETALAERVKVRETNATSELSQPETEAPSQSLKDESLPVDKPKRRSPRKTSPQSA